MPACGLLSMVTAWPSGLYHGNAQLLVWPVLCDCGSRPLRCSCNCGRGAAPSVRTHCEGHCQKQPSQGSYIRLHCEQGPCARRTPCRYNSLTISSLVGHDIASSRNMHSSPKGVTEAAAATSQQLPRLGHATAAQSSTHRPPPLLLHSLRLPAMPWLLRCCPQHWRRQQQQHQGRG